MGLPVPDARRGHLLEQFPAADAARFQGGAVRPEHGKGPGLAEALGHVVVAALRHDPAQFYYKQAAKLFKVFNRAGKSIALAAKGQLDGRIVGDETCDMRYTLSDRQVRDSFIESTSA
jgi:hypothetical protein